MDIPAEFERAVLRVAQQWSTEVWEQVVERGQVAGADAWMRERGGAVLHQVLGAALSARGERLGVQGACGCGGALRFRQRRGLRLHTVLPGREVAVRVPYGKCAACHRGVLPLLQAMGADAEGFTEALQELALLAGGIEPYESASRERLERFAGVAVSGGEDPDAGAAGGRAGGAVPA